jgi:hypothetical protein
MSNDSFSADTDGLHEQIPFVQELAANFRAIGTNLQAKLDALGPCWGPDAGGQEFYGQYAEPRDQILEGTSDTGDVLDSTVDGIKTMAVQLAHMEDENEASARQLMPSPIGDTGGASPDDHGDGRE